MRAGAIVGVLVAAAGLAPAAQAGVRADYRQQFTTPVPGASTGTDTEILYKHPDDPDAKPIPLRREVFTFPAGTTFDSSVVPACTATDIEVALQGAAACPPESRIGGDLGDTSMTGFPGDGETPLALDAFDESSGTLLIAGPEQYPLRLATHARREGRVITVDVPRTPGGPPEGESALRYVHHLFPARSLGQRAYTRTPRTCPRSGAWTFTAQFTFADGAVEEDVYRMPCRGAAGKWVSR
ncbi:MAG TPA: hypothetical protein VF520_11525 [Thermoleophilaceae bacterium]|jgi:hypothetical protein